MCQTQGSLKRSKWKTGLAVNLKNVDELCFFMLKLPCHNQKGMNLPGSRTKTKLAKALSQVLADALKYIQQCLGLPSFGPV